MKHALSAALFLAATPAFAIDPCLVGVWEADGADMAIDMELQMGNAVQHLSGRISVEISPTGVLNLLAENLTFKIEVSDIPPVDVTLEGYSTGAMNADDGSTFSAVAADYALVGSADVLGQRMEIPVSTADAGWGNATGEYSCDGDLAEFSPDQVGTFPRKLSRVR